MYITLRHAASLSKPAIAIYSVLQRHPQSNGNIDFTDYMYNTNLRPHVVVYLVYHTYLV